VSYQFVSRSIESWFDVKVEGALESGLTWRAPRWRRRREFGNQTRGAAAQLADVPDAAAAVPLERLRDADRRHRRQPVEQLGAPDRQRRLSRFELSPPPSAQLLRNVRAGRGHPDRSLDEAAVPRPAGSRPARIRALALVGARTLGLADEARLVEAVQPLPSALVANALAVQEANREYQERALGRQGLRRMYIGTLTLALFLAVFGAVLLAVLLGNQLATPLLMLADGVRQVAAGDLRPKASAGRDELAGLTRSFADMTRSWPTPALGGGRSMREVDAARQPADHPGQPDGGRHRARPAGVIQSANPGATRILRAPWRPTSATRWPHCPAGGLRPRCRRSSTSSRPLASSMGATTGSTPSSCTAPPTGPTPRPCRWWRAARPAGRAAPAGVRRHLRDRLAQRTQAWGEVARRLAHEIKNPLTPIQLSAERLEHKLADKLPEPTGAAHQVGAHHRRPGRRHEAPGQRVSRLRACPGGAAQPWT
jgi:HAMP domain-containing protein